jgi:hypothetical protein
MTTSLSDDWRHRRSQATHDILICRTADVCVERLSVRVGELVADRTDRLIVQVRVGLANHRFDAIGGSVQTSRSVRSGRVDPVLDGFNAWQKVQGLLAERLADCFCVS